MREIQKSVALVVRESGQHFELLVFDHPNAGTQIVKGTVECGESPGQAVIRELEEESGVVVDHPGRFLGTWDYIVPGAEGKEHHTWHLFWIAAPSGHEPAWVHRPSGSLEEEQHCFSFRWVRIDYNLHESLHPLFGPVARHVTEHLRLGRGSGS